MKKKIWIDLDNSPHVPFFKSINAGTNILPSSDIFLSERSLNWCNPWGIRSTPNPCQFRREYEIQRIEIPIEMEGVCFSVRDAPDI